MNLNDPQDLATLLEGILLAADKPLPLARLLELFDESGRPEKDVFVQALAVLGERCAGRAFELREVASGYRLQIRACYSPWIGRLWEERPQRYSRAMLETLALIAYRQPITRGEIEDVRGVAVSSQIIRTLQERDWIRVVGYRDVPGRPAMLATTKGFLDHFNLNGLDELPPLAVLRDLQPEQASLLEESEESTETPQGENEDAESLENVSFTSLLAELDTLEQGLKTDFDDLAIQSADDEPADDHESLPE